MTADANASNIRLGTTKWQKQDAEAVKHIVLKKRLLNETANKIIESANWIEWEQRQVKKTKLFYIPEEGWIYTSIYNPQFWNSY